MKSSTDAFSAKQYLQDFRAQYQLHPVRDLGGDRYSALVAWHQQLISNTEFRKASSYLANNAGLAVTGRQWQNIVQTFGKHLRWLANASEKLEDVNALGELPSSQRAAVVEQFFGEFIVRAAKWDPRLTDDSLKTLRLFVPEFKTITPTQDSIRDLAVLTSLDRYKEVDRRALLAMTATVTPSDTHILLRRKGPFIRARRVADETERLLKERSDLSPAQARKLATDSKTLDMTPKGDEGVADDPLVLEITLLFTDANAQLATEWAYHFRREAHEKVDIAKASLGISVLDSITEPVATDLTMDPRIIARVQAAVARDLVATHSEHFKVHFEDEPIIGGSLADTTAGIDKDADRARHLAEDEQTILNLDLGFTKGDARYFLRRSSPIIRARRVAAEADRRILNGEYKTRQSALQALMRGNQVDLTVNVQESVHDDPLVREVSALFVNYDSERAAQAVGADRSSAHEAVDRAKRQLGLDVTQRLAAPIDFELVLLGETTSRGLSLEHSF